MKKVLYVVLAIALIYLVCCLIGPAEIKVERSGTINAPVDAIKSQITDYSVFAKWSPWQEKDPNMKTTIEGEAGKVGHKYAWEGNKDVGKGTMEITSVTADKVVEKLVFDGRGANDVSFDFKPDGAGTNVTWAMNMNIGFFGRGMMMFMKGKVDKMLGGDFEKGLAKLKTVSEAAAVAAVTPKYEVKELNWEEKTYYGTKSTNLTMDKVGAFLGENLSKIAGDLTKAKFAPTSAPSCLILKWDDATMSGDMAAVFAADSKAKVKEWEKYTIPAGKVLTIAYFGGYDKIKDAFTAIKTYASEKGFTKSVFLEEYITDPMSEKDTAKWQTNIYCMVK